MKKKIKMGDKHDPNGTDWRRGPPARAQQRTRAPEATEASGSHTFCGVQSAGTLEVTALAATGNWTPFPTSLFYLTTNLMNNQDGTNVTELF